LCVGVFVWERERAHKRAHTRESTQERAHARENESEGAQVVGVESSDV